VQGRVYLLIQALRITLEGNTSYAISGSHDPTGAIQLPPYDSTTFHQTGGPWTSAGQQAIDGRDNFTLVAHDVGRALTGRFQQLATTSASGTATQSYVLVQVRWIWLIYPLTLLVLSLVALLATILETHLRHMAVWKESSLPLLYRYTGTPPVGPNGPGPGQRQPTNSISNRVSQIIEDASEEFVRLRRHHGIWTLDTYSGPLPENEKKAKRCAKAQAKTNQWRNHREKQTSKPATREKNDHAQQPTTTTRTQEPLDRLPSGQRFASPPTADRGQYDAPG